MARVISVWDRDVSGGAQEISKVGAIFLERRKRGRERDEEGLQRTLRSGPKRVWPQSP